MPGLVELKACPAFSQECPFKGATSAEDVTAKLKEIPPSHLDNSGTFYKTLEYFHRANSPTNSIGSCPVKHGLPEDWSFDQAMEAFSLASIMGRRIEASEKVYDAAGSPKTVVPEHHEADVEQNHQSRRLSDALKSGTSSAHEAAENVHFVKNFIKGQIDRDLYGLMVAQLFYVYQRLEVALDHHAPLYFPTCHFPLELSRKQSLQEDLEFWHSRTPPVSKAAQDYIDRIDCMSKKNPLLLLAHAYTRYLGDLSGGKVLARVARRALQLKEDGLAFYEFPHVESFKLFKDKYRNALNKLPLTQTQIESVVQEANVAFLLNMRLFEELDVAGGVPGATIRSLEEVYTAPSRLVSQKNDNTDAPCPFAVTSTRIPSLKKGRTCPWPFILAHDPKTGMQAWQTWMVLGLLLLYVYNTVFL